MRSGKRAAVFAAIVLLVAGSVLFSGCVMSGSRSAPPGENPEATLGELSGLDAELASLGEDSLADDDLSGDFDLSVLG